MLISAFFVAALLQAAHVEPLVRAHSHNDSERARPLAEALELGVASVEADIHLYAGRIVLGHDRPRPLDTLEERYLQPLLARVRTNGGQVIPGLQTFTLVLDIKSPSSETYAALRELLPRYSEMLTSYRGETRTDGPVRIILSGNRPRRAAAADPVRYAALEGWPDDVATPDPACLFPVISEDFLFTFGWTGRGPFPEASRKKLHKLVGAAHAAGRTIRLYNTPDNPAGWGVLYDAGVDHIQGDNLIGLRDFILSRQPKPAPDGPKAAPSAPSAAVRRVGDSLGVASSIGAPAAGELH